MLFKEARICTRELFDGGLAVEHNEGRNSTNLKVRRRIGVFVDVHLAERHGRVLLGHFLIHRLDDLAGRAPGCGEIKHGL